MKWFERLLIVILVALLIAKLTETVDWSWWIILLPAYFPFVLALIIGYYQEFKKANFNKRK
jgi:uncharacterized integral membrane protein